MQFGAQECVRHWGRYRPNAIAIQTENIAISYIELDRQVDLIAHKIDANHSGDRVGILARSKAACLMGFLAANRAGRSAITFHLGMDPQTLEECATETQPSLMIVDQFGQAAISNATSSIPILPLENEQVVQLDNDLSKIENKPEQECCVLFSSGTTGRSKGIERDHYSMVTESLGWCLELGLNRHTTFYVGRPVFYTGGLVISLATLTVGGSLVCVDSIDDNQLDAAWRGFTEMSARHKPEWAFFIPEQLRFFVTKMKKGKRGPFPKRILTMGAPISGDEKIAVSRAFKCEVVESWGNTESLGTITDPEDLLDRPDSIGRPFLTDELFIVDDAGAKLGPEQIGRIAGHREAGFTKYSNREDATKATIVGDVIISDDIGKIDDSGRFYVLGRVSDLINIKGNALTVSIIEQTVRSKHPELQFGIVVIENDQQEPRIGLLTERATAKEIRDVKALILQEYGADLRLHDMNIDSLPKLPTGKLDRVKAADILSRAPG